jgi:hypothetical protein
MGCDDTVPSRAPVSKDELAASTLDGAPMQLPVRVLLERASTTLELVE